MPELATAVAARSSKHRRLRSLARHDLCWLRCDQHKALLATKVYSVDRRSSLSGSEILSAQEALLAWTDMGRPLIVTRQPKDVPPNCCRLALCAPQSAAPRSIAVEVAVELIERVAPPTLLRDAIDAAPAIWQDLLRSIERAHTDVGLEARIFGSLGWQALTGLNYLHDQSDLDLVIDFSLEEWLASITPNGSLSDMFSRWLLRLDAAPFSLDCEVRLARDAAFSLAELRDSSRYVLARCNDRTELMARSKLRELAKC
jgi:malonate decarboxylase holo-[acyl-carrier-protein] synthase